MENNCSALDTSITLWPKPTVAEARVARRAFRCVITYAIRRERQSYIPTYDSPYSRERTYPRLASPAPARLLTPLERGSRLGIVESTGRVLPRVTTLRQMGENEGKKKGRGKGRTRWRREKNRRRRAALIWRYPL